MTNESRSRMMPVHSPILQVKQNLQDAEKRIDELTKALDLMNERQRLEWARAENAEAKVDELDATLDKVQSSWLDAKLRIDELTTVLHQLIAQINTSASVISNSLRQDGDAYAANVSTLTALAHVREDVLKMLNNAPADSDNLRDLLNASMAENVALLQQVTEMQKTLNIQIKTFDAMKLNSDRAPENWMNTCAESDKRVDQLTTALIDIGSALFKNYILAFAVRNVAPSMDELAQACETINKTLSAHSGETITLRQQLDEAQGDCNKWHDAYVALLKWSQAAYKRLNDSNGIRVPNAQEDAIIALLVAAPANVAAEVDPFSATVDEAYSIYTDLLIVGIAKSMECTIDDLVEYAYESVGAPTDGDK